MGNTTYAILDPHEPRESHGAQIRFSFDIHPDTVPFPQTYAVESESVLQTCECVQTYTMSSLDLAVASSLGTGLIKSHGMSLPMVRYCPPRPALPFGSDRRRKMPEDCQGNVRCSHVESHDCSVWVVQRLCLVSRSRGVAGLLHQSVSSFSQLNKTLYIP